MKYPLSHINLQRGDKLLIRKLLISKSKEGGMKARLQTIPNQLHEDIYNAQFLINKYSLNTLVMRHL